jgi:ADP-ribose pyrophosphatase YjhB (NUDIX family)
LTQDAPRLGCGAAIVVDGRILLLKRLRDPEAGCWGIPGGKVELFETAAAAVEREILEEVGLTIHAAALLCVADQIDRARETHWFSAIYRVDTFAGEPVNLEPHKHAAMAWFPLAAPPEPLTRATVVMLAALAGREGG